jgi:uncharacterized protein with beta-barrel porin domain
MSLTGSGGTVTLGSQVLTLSNASGTFAGAINGVGGSLVLTSGAETLSGVSGYSGATTINSGTLGLGVDNAISASNGVTLVTGATLNATAAGATITSLAGSGGTVTLGSQALTLSNASGTFAGAINGVGGSLVLTSGAETLSGVSGYSGATTINGGTLGVIGSITSSSFTTVNNGGTLTGIGAVGTTQINAGGTLAPGAMSGTSMTVIGNLAFQSGANYLVQISPSTASYANVSGTSSLAGNVLANFGAGGYLQRQYDILHSAGLGGTAFTALGTTNLPAGFTANLSYSPTDAYLNLTANMGQQLPNGGLNANQGGVAGGLNSFFNGGGTLTPNFVDIFALHAGSLTNALTSLDGEAATGAERSAFQMMTGFLDLVLERVVDGGNGAGVQAAAPTVTFKAPPKPNFEQRWTAWSAAYGGSNSAKGDPVAGSNNVTAQNYGFASGIDYGVTPDTIVGVALAGGGTAWNLSGGLGGGSGEAFQAAVYGVTRAGPAYLAGAVAFTNHWMTTSRVALGDQLTANFAAQGYGARAETGYRYAALPMFGVTPYAALQAQDFHRPSYSEADITGGGFGLGYDATDATDTRTELGARFDSPTVVNGMPLILRARLAWAHDFVGNPSLGAGFESLPGANFVVSGASIPRDSALASAAAELSVTTHLTLLARFDGEYANGSQVYAGKGTLRYSW